MITVLHFVSSQFPLFRCHTAHPTVQHNGAMDRENGLMICKSPFWSQADLLSHCDSRKSFIHTSKQHQLVSSKGGDARKPGLIDWVVVLHPTRHKIGYFGDVLPSQSLGLVTKNWNKPNNSKHASATKYTTTINEPKKTKARFSRLLQHPTWKQRGPIPVSALHKFVTYLLT